MRWAWLGGLVATMAVAGEPARAPAPPPRVSETPPTPVVRPGQSQKKKRFVQRRLARPSPGEATPLLFSRTAAPTLLPRGDATFEFEPGQPRRSVWPDAETAWLVRDLDGDGQIRSGRELFGSFTRGPRGERAKDGFEALRWLSDDDARTCSLWFDVNGNRKVDAGELRPVPFALPKAAWVDDVTCTPGGDCFVERAEVQGGWLLDLHLVLEPPQGAQLHSRGGNRK